eukprot:gene4702-8286_t
MDEEKKQNTKKIEEETIEEIKEEKIDEEEISLLDDLTIEDDVSEFDEEEQIFIGEDEIDEIKEEISVVDTSVFKFEEHKESVYAIDINPKDQHLIVTGGGDDRGFLWKYNSDDKKMEIIQELKGHKETVSNVKFNVDGSLFATGDEEGVTKIWSKEGKLVQTLEGPSEAITFMEWHPKGNVILVGSEDTTCWMFNADSGKCLQVFGGHGASVTCGKFNSSGNKIITGSEDESIKIFDPKSGECLHTFASETLSESAIHCIAPKPDDPIVFLAGTSTGEAFMISIKQKKVLAKLDAHEDSIESCTFCDGLSTFVTASMDSSICLWDSNNLKLRHKLENQDGIVKITYDSDSKVLYCGCVDGTLASWDVRQGKLIQEFTGHTQLILDFAHSKDFLVSTSDDKTARIFELKK